MSFLWSSKKSRTSCPQADGQDHLSPGPDGLFEPGGEIRMRVRECGIGSGGPSVEQGINDILRELGSRAQIHLKVSFPQEIFPEVMDRGGYGTALNQCLTRWSGQSDLPLVILLDEIDSLVGDTLISVLRQIRSGYNKRPRHFPQSIILCGVRDVRDYRIHSGKG